MAKGGPAVGVGGCIDEDDEDDEDDSLGVAAADAAADEDAEMDMMGDVEAIRICAPCDGVDALFHISVRFRLPPPWEVVLVLAPETTPLAVLFGLLLLLCLLLLLLLLLELIGVSKSPPVS